MIVVVRHGRTASNAAGLLLGRADPPLDELGRRQAEQVAAALGPVDRVVASPLLRTRQTAAALTGAPPEEVEVDDRLVELDYGAWDGRPVAEVAPEEWARWRSDLEWAPPGGESLAALGRRVRAALDELVPDAVGRTVVVVTHVSPIKAALAWALRVGDEVAWRCFVPPAAIMRVEVRGDARRSERSLLTFGETAHLSGQGSP